MPKPTIRPPRAPKGEAASVTVANQAREIDNLISRVQVLVKLNEEATTELRMANSKLDDASGIREEMATEIASMGRYVEQLEKAHNRLLGWQDCAREIINANDGKL